MRRRDRDADGISIAANALSLNGGSIKASADGTDADLTHAAVAADATRKVDGSRVPAPMVSRIAFASSPASGDTYELGETIQVRVVFDREVTVSGSPQVALTIGSQTKQVTPPRYDSAYTTQWLYFRYEVQASDRDTDGISIAANALSLNGGSIKASADGTTDADLAHEAVAADATRKVDGSRATPPMMSRIAFRGSPTSDGTYELGEMIRVEVVFDREVTVSGSPQVALTIGRQTKQATFSDSSSGCCPASSGLHFEYEVEASDRDADGISIAANALSLNGGSIKASADGTTDADLTHKAVAADATRKVDGSQATAPKVSRIFFDGSPVSGDTYELGETIQVGVVFDREVTVSGSPQVALTIGGRTKQATQPSYYSDDATRWLYFEYEVGATDRDADGISIAADALSLNGGSIKKSADGITDADLTHEAVATDAARKVDGRQVTAPKVSRISFDSSPASGDTYELGETIQVGVVFDREVTVSGEPQVALTIGSRTRQATLPSSGDATRWLYFEYKVEAADRDTDGISITADALSLNGGSIKASADGTTAADLAHEAVAADATRKVDGRRVTAPMVRSIRRNDNSAPGHIGVGKIGVGDQLSLVVTFDRPVRVTGNPQLALTVGSRTRPATYAFTSSASGFISGGSLVFIYRVQAADRGEVISIAANSLSLNGGAIKAAADNTTDAVLAHDAIAGRLTVDDSPGGVPTVSNMGIGSTFGATSLTRGDVILVTVQFDRAVRVSGSPQVALTIGNLTRKATLWALPKGVARSSQFGENTLYFEYTVQAADRDTDGISIAANALSLNGGTIKAVADGITDANVTHDTVTSHHTVDGSQTRTAAKVGAIFGAVSAPESGDTYGLGETIEVWVLFDGPVTVTGNPQLGVTIGDQTRQATYSARRLLGTLSGVQVHGEGGGPGRGRDQHRGRRDRPQRRFDQGRRHRDRRRPHAPCGAGRSGPQGGWRTEQCAHGAEYWLLDDCRRRHVLARRDGRSVGRVRPGGDGDRRAAGGVDRRQ